MISRRAAVSLAVIVPLGILGKFYSGPGKDWVNNSLGGVSYEIFWCLFVVLIYEKARPAVVAVSVCLATCALEAMQLWHPPFLEYLRSSFIGVTVLGSQFSWSDFPYYLIGSVAGWAWMEAIRSRAPIGFPQ